MASALFCRLAEEVKGLTPEEQAQLRKALEEILLDEVDRQLVADGLMSHIPSRPTEEDIKRHREYKPITISGKPLSESIIEDRR